MSDQLQPRGPGPSMDIGNLLVITHVVYALHAFALVSAVFGAATILFAFLAAPWSIAAVILNYFKQAAARGTWLESHFRWQIRTFWFALLWVVVIVLLSITVVGIPLALMLFLGVSIWVLYRIARGWWTLGQGETMPMPPPLGQL